jgi:hypothetical protein
MTPRSFRKLVIAYGGDLRRWPETERTKARALARATPMLSALLAEAAQLDQMLERLGSGSALSERRLRGLIKRAAREIAAAAPARTDPPRPRRKAPTRAAEDC